ncbi:hypothetical protein HYW74_02615 [Candidatus Pacearchaeota archaeon]|nr:hypothetical protein [Candidatus Pacearchaeota archaeon]
MTNLEVKLTTQSFRDAGGLETFPMLEMAGIIIAGINRGEGKINAMRRVNEALKSEAEGQKCMYVFGVEYTFEGEDHPDYNRWNCIAKGTGYVRK